MERRTYAVVLATAALIASSLGLTQGERLALRPPTARGRGAGAAARRRRCPPGSRDVTAIGGLSEPVSVAFAADGTAFIALKTGVIKSFDYDARNRPRSSRPPRRPTSPTSSVDGQQLRRPRDDRHRRRPAVPGPPLRLRQLHLQPRPARQPADRCRSGAPRASSTTTARRAEADLTPPVKTRVPGDGPGLPADRREDRARLDDDARQRAPAGDRTAARSSPATRPVTWPSGRTASSTPRPVTAPASAARTSARPTTRCADPDQRGRLAARPGPAHRAATRSASTARSSGSNPDAAAEPDPGDRRPVAGGHGPAQPVAAHLPARARSSSGASTSAPATGRRSTTSSTPRPTALVNRGLALLRGHHRTSRCATPPGTRSTSRSARTCTPRAPARSRRRPSATGPAPAPDPLTPGENCPVSLVDDVGRRLHAARDRLAGGLPGRAVLLRLPARLHLAAREGRQRPAGPGARSGSSRRPAGAPVDLTTGPGGDLYYVDYGMRQRRRGARAPAACTGIDYIGADRPDREVVAEEGEDQGRRQAAQGAVPRRASTRAPR